MNYKERIKIEFEESMKIDTDNPFGDRIVEITYKHKDTNHWVIFHRNNKSYDDFMLQVENGLMEWLLDYAIAGMERDERERLEAQKSVEV